MNASRTPQGPGTPDTPHVSVVNADKIQADDLPLGRLESIDDAALAAFLKLAWEAPGDWHRLPSTFLALRAIPTFSPTVTTSFEIRLNDSPLHLYRYEFDSKNHILRYWRNNQVDCPDVNSDHGLPGDPLKFALMVAAYVREKPDFRAPDHLVDNEVFRAETTSADSVVNGPLQRAFAGLVARVENQWFGPRASHWGDLTRCCVALAGSGTFVGVWYAYVILDPRSRYEWLRNIASGEDVIPGVQYIVISAIALWFAWLASWKTRGYGPIRLYFGGFLLPYLVWILISNIPGVEMSQTVPPAPE